MKRLADDSPFAAAETGTLPVPGWQARLSLGFTDDNGTTRLTERTHCGPLRVQKPLYPEGGTVCHTIVIHPPGGVVGGDELALRVRVGDTARACITTPGAAKWYKANGRISKQEVRLEVMAGASLEWLPQETIFFDAAQVELENTIELGPDASYIGGEILCFGRTASGESFASGRVAQRTLIRREGRPVWFEQGTLHAGSAAMTGPLGLCGKTVCATIIGVGKPLPPAGLALLREECAAIAAGSGAFGATQMKSVVTARYLGDSSETAKQLMMRVWQALRPVIIGRDAALPRIWNT
jgi:urease accessory protein